MLNIFVCDDEAVFIDIVGDETRKFMNSLGKEYRIYSFLSSREFKDFIESEAVAPDVVFLDIKMPEVNGHELALLLKSKYPDCQLVFITSVEDEIYDAFDYNANGFISKYCMMDKFDSTLRRVVANAEANAPENTFLTLISDDGGVERVRLCFNDIVFLECIMRKVYVTTSDGQCRRVRCDSWREVMEKFSRSPFSVPHQNYIVNLKYVARMKDDCIYLTYENKIISVSRHRRKDFVSEYNSFSFSK